MPDRDGPVKVAVLGATGTGKSTFIHLLTGYQTGLHSELSDLQTAYYTDAATGRLVILIDTPGFDDSREGMTDTDVLQKLIDFLDKSEGKKLDGIIYMHRISAPRVSGIARKNFRISQALLGEKSLRNFFIVTTNWDRDHMAFGEGLEREELLKQGAFQALIVSGAQMHRHYNNVHSAQAIMAGIISPKEVSTDNTPSGITDTTRMINSVIQDMKNRQDKQLADLRREMENAARDSDKALRAEFAAERRFLEEKIIRANKDIEELKAKFAVETSNLKKEVEELRAKREIDRNSFGILGAEFLEIAMRTEEVWKEVRRLPEQTSRYRFGQWSR